jgi:hypothetical protein
MAINTMGAPSYAPVRQDSQVIRTNAEYEAMRAAAEAKARAAAQAKMKAAQQASGYDEYAQRYRNAPSVAEIMLQTGAAPSQAVDIRRYQDWDNYAPEDGWGQQDLVSIQRNLNDPNRVAPEFQWKWSEPEQAGSILPSYKTYDNGSGGGLFPTGMNANGLILRDASGKTVGSLGYGFGKDRLQQEAMGLGLGQAALEEFAQRNGAKDWASLNWDMDVNQDPAQWSSGGWGSGTFIGNTNTRRGNPNLWGGSYAIRTPDGPTTYNPDGTVVPFKDSPDYQEMLKRDAWFGAFGDYARDLQPIKAMNADFASNMAGRNENQLRNQQGYSSLLGNGLFGGLLNDDYSNPFFGQITGREAAQSPFAMSQQGPYPWSTPTQQLDVSSLLSPGYGGPQGGGSMGSYGKAGGLGGLGGMSGGQSSGWGGIFGAKNPWSPS